MSYEYFFYAESVAGNIKAVNKHTIYSSSEKSSYIHSSLLVGEFS